MNEPVSARMLLVICNVPDRETAERIAQALVEQQLAACVNILAPCTSVYRWGGKVEQAGEVPLLVKTREAVYPALERTIRELHPYELPEIVAVPVERGLPEYLDWLIAGTGGAA